MAAAGKPQGRGGWLCRAALAGAVSQALAGGLDWPSLSASLRAPKRAAHGPLPTHPVDHYLDLLLNTLAPSPSLGGDGMG